MSGIYFYKWLAYAVLGIFLLLERHEVIFHRIDFELMMSIVLIIVAALEFGVNFLMWVDSITNKKHPSNYE